MNNQVNTQEHAEAIAMLVSKSVELIGNRKASAELAGFVAANFQLKINPVVKVEMRQRQSDDALKHFQKIISESTNPVIMPAKSGNKINPVKNEEIMQELEKTLNDIDAMLAAPKTDDQTNYATVMPEVPTKKKTSPKKRVIKAGKQSKSKKGNKR